MRSLAPNILLVGESRERVRHLDECIALAGWHSTLANDCDSAVAAIRSMAFDVVIADIQLSAKSTSNFLKLVHHTRPEQAILVVADSQTAHSASEVQPLESFDTILYPEDLDVFKQSVLDMVAPAEAGVASAPVRLSSLTHVLLEYEFTSEELARAPFELGFLQNLEEIGSANREVVLQVKLAFQEAITNSLEHGNLELESEWKDMFDSSGLDKYSLTKKARLADSKYAQRRIFLTVEYARNELRFVIKDEGNGFSLPRQETTSADQVLCYGRGLAMISSAMDSVQYREEGRLIEMRRKLQHV